MKVLRKLLIGASVFAAGLFLLSPQLSAAIVAGDTIKIDRNAGGTPSPFDSYVGTSATTGNSAGEFRVRKKTGTTYSDDFKTFCLERTEYISIGGVYEVKGIDSYAVGGGSSPTNGAAYDTAAGEWRDELSDITKWLYSAYRRSELDDLVADFKYDLATSMDAFQNVVWVAEDEFGSGSLGSLASGLATDLYNWADDQGGYDTQYGQVKVMNIVTNKTNKQSQLFYDPTVPPPVVVPEPFSVAIWGGFGAIGMLVGRRRRRRSAMA